MLKSESLDHENRFRSRVVLTNDCEKCLIEAKDSMADHEVPK